jgi:hypothetical protein
MLLKACGGVWFGDKGAPFHFQCQGVCINLHPVLIFPDAC